MEDPLYTNDFIKSILKEYSNEIVGVTLAKGGRLKIGKKSKAKYLLSLLLIMGIYHFVRNIIVTLSYNLIKKIAPQSTLTLAGYAKNLGIFVNHTDNPNSDTLQELLKTNEIDIIINQSQFILKKSFLDIPKIGVLNRHNALLPKNKGRLTPFWVLHNGENETGVSIHFVDEGIDTGEVLVQKKFNIETDESFNSLVKKNYFWAITAVIEAIEKIRSNDLNPVATPYESCYNSIPTLKDAFEYRLARLKLNK